MTGRIFSSILLICIAIISKSQSEFADAIETIFAEHQLMGMSVIPICYDHPVDEVYLGYRDYYRELLVDNNTQYRIASVSKFVTATGLMKLREIYNFSLDADISTFLGYEVRNPLYPDTEITLRMLLSHTSSLQDAPAYSAFLNATFSQNPVPSIAELVIENGDYYTSNIWRTEMPGTYFVYSNLNFGLIASVMEVISGERFDVLMKAMVLEPLNMEGSYNVQDLEDINDLAVLYRYEEEWISQADDYQGNYPDPLDLSGYVPGTNGLIFGPQGGLRCSANDLAYLLSMHINEGEYGLSPFLSPESIEEMHSPNWTYNGSNGDNYYGLFREWGLGVHRTTNATQGDIVFSEDLSENGLVIGHPGEAYGLISDMYFAPNGVGGIIILINGAQNGYDFADNSAYYQVEQDIFEATMMHFEIPLCPMNIEGEKLNEQLKFYPNPASTEITVDVPQGAQFLRIYSVDGRKCLEFNCTNPGYNSYNIEAIEHGSYILSVQKYDGILNVPFYVVR